MKIKLAFVVTFLLLLFLGVGLVSASDNMDNSIGISDNADSLKTTSNNDIAIDDVEENNDNDDTVSNPTVTNEKNDGEKLKSNNDILNYSSLNETINSNSSDLIELEHDYVYNDADDSRFIALGGILVSRDLTIDGQGHYIDLGGKLRFISTWGHHITLKNIKILNGYDQWNGGGAVAIWGDAQTPGQGTFIDMEFSNINGSGVYIKSGTGTFERTKFTSCEGIGDTCQGAAVYIEGEGNFIDSIFDKNKAYQGTVFINGYASFNNCNFTDNEGIFGGAARIMGNVSFSNSRFSNNKADTEGGAASIVGQATITDSIFEGNQGPTGGALAIYGNDNSFTKTTFDDNTATSYGGAVAIWGNNNTFIEVKSNRNKVTSGVGGALYIEGNDTNIKNSEFDGNIAGTDGGAVYILNEGNECNINIEKSNFTNNSADLTSSGNGGAVYVKGCTFVDSCNFINNGAYYGGAFRAWNFASINNTKFDANYAIKDGGAASINGYANITNSNFNENKAYKCGALSLYSQNEYVLYLDYLDNNVFTSNIANTTYGGAVAIWGQNIQFTNNNLTNNKAVSKGGAVYIYGNASIINSILNENEAEDGGAIFLNGTASITNSAFNMNQAKFRGGAIFLNGTGNIMASNFTNNGGNDSEDGNGAAVRIQNGDCTIVDAIISDNHAGYNGGAISALLANVTIENSTLDANTAFYGGAVYVYGGIGTFVNTLFTNNTALGKYDSTGGAVHIEDGNGSFTNASFINNKCVNGGAVGILGTGTFENCTFTNNVAYNHGGAVSIVGTGSFVNSGFAKNKAFANGGAVYIAGNATITGSNFTENVAENGTEEVNGGAIRIENGVCTIVESNLSNNNAGYDGGAISAILADVKIENSILNNNSAPFGGAVYVYGGNNTFVNVIFTNNTALGKDDSTGGAVHIEDGNGSFTNASFSDNTCFNGGAVGILGTGTFVDSTFTNNVAYNQGGAVSIVGDCEFKNTIFENNNATFYGGAVYVKGDVYIDRTSFCHNFATIASALFVNNNCIITNSVFTNNTGVKNEYAIIHNMESILIDTQTVLDSDPKLWWEYVDIEVQPSELIGGKPSNITFNVTCIDDTRVNNGVIFILEDGAKIAEGQVISGIGTVILENLTPGVHTLYVYYNGENDYTEIINEINVTVKDAVNMDVSVNNITYGQDATILINFDNINVTGLAYIVYGGHQYPTTITTGIGSITVPGLNAGNYNFEVIFESNDYHADNANATFTVYKKASSIVAKTAAFVINYAGTYQITVNVPIANIPVTFTLNGKKVATSKTSASGIVKITLTAAQLKTAGAGTRNLVINYDGNENYKPANATAKITIKKENTKFANVKSVKSYYKRTAKAMQLTATLKNSKNKVIKNQYVTFKVNNKKTYKVKTNSKGVAILKLNLANIKACKLNKKGIYKFTVTYPVRATYNKATANGKLKVIR